MAQILTLGVTGYTGKLIARYLLERSDVMITIATRHKDKAMIFENEINRHHARKLFIQMMLTSYHLKLYFMVEKPHCSGCTNYSLHRNLYSSCYSNGWRIS